MYSSTAFRLLSKTNNYNIYLFENIIQNLCQFCLLIDSWTSVSFEPFYVSRHWKSFIHTLPHFSFLGENAFSCIMSVQWGKDEKWGKLCCGGRTEIILVFLKAVCEAFQCFYSRGQKDCHSVSDLNFCVDVLCDKNSRSTTAAWQIEKFFSLLRCQAMRQHQSITTFSVTWLLHVKNNEISVVRSHVAEEMLRLHSENICIFSRLLLLRLK